MSRKKTLSLEDVKALESEDGFQQAIIDLARLLGWRCYHTYRSDRSEPGFPDLVMIKNGTLLVMECKREDKGPTPDQEEWIAAFAGLFEHSNLKGFAGVKRPSDWDEIEQAIKSA